MLLPSPAALSRVALRDGSLDLSLSAFLLVAGAFAGLGSLRATGTYAAWMVALVAFGLLRRRVFLPRAGHVRLRVWRMVAPLLVVGFALTLGGLLSAGFHGGPVPPGSVWDRTPSELFLGCTGLAAFAGWASLGLRRLGGYGVCVLAGLLAHLKGVPAAPVLLGLALVPLAAGAGLMLRFLQEPRHAEA